MKQENRKPTVRQDYRDFAEKALESEFEKFDDKQRSYALLRFYVEKIHNPLGNQVSEEDFAESYVDNWGDLGADLIYRDDGNVLILQSKYAAPNKPVSAEDISYFKQILGRLNARAFVRLGNSKAREAINEIDFSSDTFSLRFIALGRIENQAKAATEQAAVIPDIPGLADRAEFEFLDEFGLNEKYRQALSIDRGASVNAEIVTFGKRGKRSAIIELPIGDHRSCVMVVPAIQIVKLYQQHKEALFNLNVRNYIGNTATNKEIIRTGRDDPTSFFHLNNGISCLASDFEIDDQNDRVRVTGLQIINGAQTVKSLVKASQDKTWVEEKEPALLVRITEVRAYGSAGQFRERIIRGNNTQNIIKASDFRSNDPVQTDLIRKFAVIHRGGKEVQYVPKRTDRPKPNAITIRLEEFAKAVYSFLCDPVKFSASTSFLFDDGETGGYRSVFGDGEVVWHFMPEREFRLRSAIWWLSLEFGNRLRDEKKKLDERIGDERDDEKKNEAVLERHALERKWPFIFSAGLLLQQGNRGSGYVDDLLKTYKGDWKFGEGTTGKWFEQIYEKSRKSIVWLYKQASKQPGFEHRNWMRSNSTVASIREFFADAPFDPVTRLPSRAD